MLCCVFKRVLKWWDLTPGHISGTYERGYLW